MRLRYLQILALTPLFMAVNQSFAEWPTHIDKNVAPGATVQIFRINQYQADYGCSPLFGGSVDGDPKPKLGALLTSVTQVLQDGPCGKMKYNIQAISYKAGNISGTEEFVMYVYPSGGWGGSANRIKLKISVGGHSISQAPKQPSPRRTPSTKPATMREASQQPSPGSPTANAFRIAPGLISELDALMQERYRKCWEFRGNTATRYIPLIKVEFMVNGALANEPMLLNPPQEPDLRGLAESALRAVRRCDPLSIPAQFVPYHQDWKSRILRFDPEEMAKSRESGTTQNARAIQNQQSQSSNDSDGNKPEEPDVKRFGFFAPVPKKELESSPKTSNTSPGNAQDSYTATLYGMIVPLVRVPPGLPPISQRRPLQVEFVVDGRGRLAGTAVTKSSGVPSLDIAVLYAIRKAAPYPPTPHGKPLPLVLDYEPP